MASRSDRTLEANHGVTGVDTMLLQFGQIGARKLLVDETSVETETGTARRVYKNRIKFYWRIPARYLIQSPIDCGVILGYQSFRTAAIIVVQSTQFSLALLGCGPLA